MRLKDVRFYISILLIAVILCIITSVFSLSGHAGIIRNAVGTLSMPIRTVVTFVGDKVENVRNYFGNVNSLQKEKELLQKENESLRNQLDDVKNVLDENKSLKEYLELKENLSEYSFVEARIVGYESQNYHTLLVINKGTMNGLKINQAVITNEGLVGRICEVGLNWAKISTVLETSSFVGAYIERSGELGTVEGNINLRYEGYCTINYLKNDSDIVIGDKVITSGVGSIYPAGLKIGSVEEIRVDPYNRTLYACIKPAVDFSPKANIQKVMVLVPAEENPS